MTVNLWCAAISGVTITIVTGALWLGLLVSLTTYAALRLIDRTFR